MRKKVAFSKELLTNSSKFRSKAISNGSTNTKILILKH